MNIDREIYVYDIVTKKASLISSDKLMVLSIYMVINGISQNMNKTVTTKASWYVVVWIFPFFKSLNIFLGNDRLLQPADALARSSPGGG